MEGADAGTSIVEKRTILCEVTREPYGRKRARKGPGERPRMRQMSERGPERRPQYCTGKHE